MKISEAIKRLESILNEDGDIDLVTDVEIDYCCVSVDVGTIEVKYREHFGDVKVADVRM